jgi:YggT family protein
MRARLRSAACKGYTWRRHHLERGTMVLLRLIDFLGYLVQLYVYVIIASVILSWLMAFGVVNPYNPTVRAIWQGLNAVTEPLLRPIRNMMPNLGAIDISPIVLLLACFFVQSVVLGSLRDLLLTAG